MNAIEEIKKDIAVFLKKDEGLIDNDTPVDRAAVGSSIMIYRMHSVISKKTGRRAQGYDRIKTFGDLLASYGLLEKEKGAPEEVLERPEPVLPASDDFFSIGIDMEKADNLPEADDFRKDDFYRQNFSEKEISYCLMQPNPAESFAGRFAAKEAVVKADNSYRNTPFNKIEIENGAGGRPRFKNFSLSISHADGFAVAVAVCLRMDLKKP